MQTLNTHTSVVTNLFYSVLSFFKGRRIVYRATGAIREAELKRVLLLNEQFELCYRNETAEEVRLTQMIKRQTEVVEAARRSRREAEIELHKQFAYLNQAEVIAYGEHCMARSRSKL